MREVPGAWLERALVVAATRLRIKGERWEREVKGQRGTGAGLGETWWKMRAGLVRGSKVMERVGKHQPGRVACGRAFAERGRKGRETRDMWAEMMVW